MVAQRAALLRSGTDETAPGKLLRAQAERLVVELGDSWNWDESVQDLGKSNRVQRGSEVIRLKVISLNLGDAVSPSGNAPHRGDACRFGRFENYRSA